MKAPEEEPEELNTNLDDNDAEGLHMEAIGYKQLPSSQLRARDRFDRIATLVCGMVAFARNRRHNGILYLSNASFSMKAFRSSSFRSRIFWATLTLKNTGGVLH
ncbi:hypothetical protein PSHT_05289 [Puccinia striiformis]|uniref:Uncharacterized protein n=1 Tax=Puccinia striiformis TaxID=27350 RepID=A0A2S4WAS1_9BASI|nr:hypothetical protein PSHT_05289 [Puccinia striiformis]